MKKNLMVAGTLALLGMAGAHKVTIYVDPPTGVTVKFVGRKTCVAKPVSAGAYVCDVPTGNYDVTISSSDKLYSPLKTRFYVGKPLAYQASLTFATPNIPSIPNGKNTSSQKYNSPAYTGISFDTHNG